MMSAYAVQITSHRLTSRVQRVTYHMRDSVVILYQALLLADLVEVGTTIRRLRAETAGAENTQRHSQFEVQDFYIDSW